MGISEGVLVNFFNLLFNKKSGIGVVMGWGGIVVRSDVVVELDCMNRVKKMVFLGNVVNDMIELL